MKIKKGDTIKVLSGKDRGKIGKVLSVLRDTNRVVVEKVNIVKKHERQSNEQKKSGGIIEVERPIDISNVSVICQSCNKPTRIGFKIKNGEKRRYCKKCKKIIDNKT